VDKDPLVQLVALLSSVLDISLDRGPPGTGKSFVVQAVGYQAIKQGFFVLYRSIFDVVRGFMHHETLGDED
jgi:hypothetical protein